MFSIAYGWKLLGQVVFLMSGLACFKMGEREAGMLLIGIAGGSVVPVAEQHKRKEVR